MTHIPYRLAARVTHRIPGIGGKLARSLAGRRQAQNRWVAWAASHRTADPLIWVHAASVGEALTAVPIVSRIKAREASVQMVLSYSSPSAAAWSWSGLAAHADYIPLEEPASVSRVFDAVRPSLIVFARGDLWPEFVTQAARRSRPITIVGGSVRPESRRLAWPAKPVLRRVYRSVTWVGAVSAEDGARYVDLGVPPARVDVTGDPRHDQVLERPVSLSIMRSLGEWAENATVLVAGSTDRADARIVLDAFAAVTQSLPRLRLLLVPHEPVAQHVAEVTAQASARGLDAEIWNPDGFTKARCLIASRMGTLADLYALAHVAYVGGGYGRGVHAVSEPAVFAVPVTFGPRHEESPDAVRLVGRGGAVALPERRHAANALASVLRQWTADAAARSTAGLNARRVIAAGAAAASAAALLRFLDSAR